MPYALPWYLFYTVLLWLKNSSATNKTWQWDYAPGIHWFNHVPYYPEVAGWVEWWNNVLKTQPQF